ncbi:MAG: dihydropteroate synthase [Pseudomonadota bacterium]
MPDYFRPLAQTGVTRPDDALPLAGTSSWFTHVEMMGRGVRGPILPASDMPEDWRGRLTRARAPIASVDMTAPRIMGILNVTPDSFSDGGQHQGIDNAAAAAQRMISAGAEILDIGGESTRPGAQEVDIASEIERTAPVIAALQGQINVPISIDTRKSAVAEAAFAAGAQIANDVSGLMFDSKMAAVCAERTAPICVMHSQGLPKTMQHDPRYDDVLLDVYDFLDGQLTLLEDAGLPRDRIIIDPGIGFGKTMGHNIALIQGLSLFHGLGCALLLGVSRKGFIGTLGSEPEAARRAPGSVALALDAVRQGVHILRVHDVDETRQALALWRAAQEGIET